MMVSLAAYPYSPLPKGDVFRYLILQPGIGDQPLKCNIRTALIAETEFEALSYLWGRSVRDHFIVCDGHFIAITSNLFQALRQFRRADHPITLWVDSICISQEDLEEKGSQVALMGKIYTAARHVLLFFGSDDKNQGPTLQSLLEDVDVMLDNAFKYKTVTWKSLPYPDSEDDPILDRTRWLSMCELLSHDWFHRGWVVQEALLAQRGQVVWGKTRIDWDKLMRAYLWVSTATKPLDYSLPQGGHTMNTFSILYLERHETFGRALVGDYMFETRSFLRILNAARELKLSDPHDRIYAFMGLPQEHQINLSPNYQLPYFETYRRFAFEYIKTTKTTELLDYITPDRDEETVAKCPSWVPRWDIPVYSMAYSSSATTPLTSREGCMPEPHFLDDKHLSVRGVIIDTILYASEVFNAETTTPETVWNTWNEVKKCNVVCPYDDEESQFISSQQLDTFLDLLSTYDPDYEGAKEEFAIEASLKQGPVGECQFRYGDDSSDYGDFSDGESQSHEESLSDHGQSSQEDDNLHDYCALIQGQTHNFKFILTERGYMGLATPNVRKGDACAIIFGCQTPCVLRQADGEEAFIHLGATSLIGKRRLETTTLILGETLSKDWVDWDVEEQDIVLC